MNTLAQNVNVGDSVYFPQVGEVMGIDKVEFGYGSKTGIYWEGRNQLGQPLYHLAECGEVVTLWQ